MKLKDVFMICSNCTIIMKGNDELLCISTCYCNAMMMLSENFVRKQCGKNRT